MADTKAPRPSKSCPLLNLPPELFDMVVKKLSPASSGNLLQCNRELHRRPDLWVQRLHVLLPLADSFSGFDRRLISMRLRPMTEESNRRWTAFKEFITEYPEKAGSLQCLTLQQYCPAVNTNNVISALQSFPSLAVMDLRGTWLSAILRSQIARSIWDNMPAYTVDYGAHWKRSDIVTFWRAVGGRKGIRVVLDLAKVSSDTSAGTYRQFQLDASEGTGRIHLRFEGIFLWQEIEWSDCKENKLLVWTGIARPSTNVSRRDEAKIE